MGSREDDGWWDVKYAEEWEDEDMPEEGNDENIVLDEELDDETLRDGNG